MALCPFARHRLIPPGSSDPRITPRVAVLHVDAGNAESLYEYFRDRSGGVESHFHVTRAGVIEQYRDTNWQADANNLANDFAVAIETQGYGEGEWTPEQLAAIKRLLLWLNNVHPAIRLAECDRWDGSGVGYHIQFGTPGPWTPVAKSCPGPGRVAQFNNVIVPWLNAGAPDEEEDVALSEDDKKWIIALIDNAAKKAAEEVLAAEVVAKKDITVRKALRELLNREN